MARIPKEVVEHFRAVPLFSTVSNQGLRVIVSVADEFDEPSGRVLVREGEHRRELMVLVSGTAKVSRNGRRIASLGPGDFFGEIALLSGGPRTATVTTTSDVRLMMLAPAGFEGVLETEPAVRRAVLHALGERLRETSASKLGC
jgi:CRP-like cAMP-binding protein